MKKTLDITNLKPAVVESLQKKLKGKGYGTSLEGKKLTVTTKNEKKDFQADVDAIVKKIVAEVK